MENKNRLITATVESDEQAADQFIRLAEILAELLDTYPSSVEEILHALEKRIYISASVDTHHS